jgi:hypothetical protein
MLLSFELMPNGGPPSPIFQAVFDARVQRVQNTSFQHWLAQKPEAEKFVVLVSSGLKWLPTLDDISREMTDRRLGDVYGALSDELRKGSPESKSVSLLGAEIPGILLVYAAPLTLAALSYYFFFHLTHLSRFARERRLELQRFAWLPLSMEIAWAWEAWISLGALPLLALAVLSLQLFRFHFLQFVPGLFIVLAMILLSMLARQSIQQIETIRAQLGRPAKGIRSVRRKGSHDSSTFE